MIKPITRQCETCNETITCGYVLDNGATIRHYCDFHEPDEYIEWHDAGLAWWTDWYDEVEVAE